MLLEREGDGKRKRESKEQTHAKGEKKSGEENREILLKGTNEWGF